MCKLTDMTTYPWRMSDTHTEYYTAIFYTFLDMREGAFQMIHKLPCGKTQAVYRN